MQLMKTTVPGLMKDKVIGTLINTNIDEYKTILAHRDKKKIEDQLKDEVKSLQSDLAEIKLLLRKLTS